MARKRRKHLLFVHYNSHSSGSFVDKTLAQIDYLKDEYDITVAVPGQGPFADRVAETGVSIVFRSMHENEGVLRYGLNGMTFLRFLQRSHVDLVYFLDYVWWKPAEFLAARLLRVPVVSYCGFYKSAGDLQGFIASSSQIVVNSESTAATFRDCGLGPVTHVIHNFVDPERYSKPDNLGIELGVEQAPVIGYLGALHPIKGIEYLLHAFAEIRRRHALARCLIVGREKEIGYEATLRALTVRLGIERAVQFIGHRSDVSRVLHSLSLLVVPSVDEPFGFVNVEAGAAAVPVIASRVGGIPEIVIDGETGFLVNPRDSAQITARCLELLGSPALRRRMGDAARERVKRRFSKDVILPQWGAVFLRALSGTGACVE